jgi:hypothetical protein
MIHLHHTGGKEFSSTGEPSKVKNKEILIIYIRIRKYLRTRKYSSFTSSKARFASQCSGFRTWFVIFIAFWP